MAPANVLYTSDAKPVCFSCNSKLDLVDTDKRAADNIRKAGYTCLAAGVIGLVAPIAHFGFLIACIVVALTSGIFAIQSLARGNERFTKWISKTQRDVLWVVTIIGIALCALSLMGMNFARFIITRG